MAGVNVPLHSAEHFYVVTEHDRRRAPRPADPARPRRLHLLQGGGRRPGRRRLRAGGQAVGRRRDEIPYPFEFQLLEEDWEHFAVLMDSALLRIPALEETGIQKFYNGPESFTPDNQFILGEAPEVRELLRRRRVQLGRHRDRRAARAGRWRSGSSTGAPTSDLTGVDIRRFAPFNGNNRWLHDRVAEVLGLHYEVPWPNREMTTARPFRRSPVHHLLRGRQRQLRQQDGLGARQLLRARRCRPGDRVHLGQAELAAVVGRRADAAPAPASTVFDQTSFSKYLLVAGRTPSRRCSGCAPPTSPCRSGRTVYTGMLNARGTYESDVTVTRTGADEFLHRQQRRHHRARQGPHPPEPARRAPRATLVDVTSAYAVFGVMGPAVARPAVRADRRRPVRRGVPVRHQPRDLARATRPCAPPGSPTSASSAGSSTCPPSSRSASTRT